MILTTSIFLLSISLILYLKENNIISPVVVSPLSWGLVLFLYFCFQDMMIPLSGKVLWIIIIWNISLIVGVLCSYKIKICKSVCRYIRNDFNESIVKLYFYISLIGLIPYLYVKYKQINDIYSGNIFFDMRMIDTGILESDYSMGIVQYVLSFSYVLLMIYCINYYIENRYNKKFLIVIIVNVIFAILSMSKSSILFPVISLFAIFSLYNKIPIKRLLCAIILIYILFYTVQSVRSADSDDNISKTFFTSYFLAGIPALDKIVQSDMSSSVSGRMVFSIYYNSIKKFSPDDYVSSDFKNDITDNGYIYVPYPTNVYTMIGSFWLDYKYYGVILFSFIIGYLSGYFYKLYRSDIKWGVIIYSYLLCVLILQFFGEYIFRNLSYFIQLIALSYVANNFKYRFRWGK